MASFVRDFSGEVKTNKQQPMHFHSLLSNKLAWGRLQSAVKGAPLSTLKVRDAHIVKVFPSTLANFGQYSFIQTLKTNIKEQLNSVQDDLSATEAYHRLHTHTEFRFAVYRQIVVSEVKNLAQKAQYQALKVESELMALYKKGEKAAAISALDENAKYTRQADALLILAQNIQKSSY